MEKSQSLGVIKSEFTQTDPSEQAFKFYYGSGDLLVWLYFVC